MTSIALTWYFTSIHLFFFLSMSTNLVLGFNLSIQNHIMCIETERQTLLSFKQGLDDSYDILSSWDTRVNDDCCNWGGVQCNNITGHIVRLDLRGSIDHTRLMGQVGSSLAQLSHLNYLDLSHNFFYGTLLENNIGSLINLNYLNLSNNHFEGVIPPHLGNLSKLAVLDLGSNYQLFSNDNLGWLSSLSSLKHLDLSFVNLSSVNDWASVINKLTLLQSLSFRSCALPQPILPSHSYTNFSRFLVELDLSSNFHLNSSISSWLIHSSNSLLHLNLSFNNLKGLNVDDFGNMTSLVFLDLRSTKVNLHSTKYFENLCNLKSLYLSGNNGGGLLSDFLKIFPRCILNSLQYLDLASNKFLGFLPNFTMLSSLKKLDLSHNMLNGTIPQSLGQLSSLEHLDFRQNSLTGEVSEAHLSNLTNLQYFDLSRNSLVFNLASDWVPPFRLKSILLRSCKLGPLFPRWLRTQNFSDLDISNAEISDIIPHWFWNNLSPKLKVMNLSWNKIKGEIPNLSVKFKKMLEMIILQSNEFEGEIPAFLLLAPFLDLSNNKFSHLTSLCEITDSPLYALDLSGNQLSRELPNCWDHMPNLQFLSLANNNFYGDIPRFIGNLTRLRALNLRDNQFSGQLPYWFNSTNLVVLDVMNNNLSGTIPLWIGSKLPNLIRLTLKSNQFHGNLPSSLCNLTSIQVLDISSNYITGSIPTCIRNFNILTRTSLSKPTFCSMDDLVMMWKGKERLVEGELLGLERSIDLSSNHLAGKIPNEITKLVGLISLNLSRNELTGQIPDNVGQLRSLNFLDLSRNCLSGPIPPSFSHISRLGVLDLSYNNLSGKIPTGTQLQGFPTSSYEGNPYLCGDPLQKCYGEVTQEPTINNVHVENENSNEDKLILREFFISMAFGFIVGFWGIFGSLVLHRRWRHMYFKFFKDIIDKVI